MFERFTERARKAMAYANQEAQRFNHEYIGPEHIVLGLAKEGTGVGVAVMKSLGRQPRDVRLAMEKLMTPGAEMVTMGKLPQTALGRAAIHNAIDEARILNHNYVGTEHLLLGVLKEMQGLGGVALRNLGMTLETTRAETLRLWEISPEGDQKDGELLTSAAWQGYRQHRMNMLGRVGEAAQLSAQVGAAPLAIYLGGQNEDRVETFLVGLSREDMDALMERVAQRRGEHTPTRVFTLELKLTA